MSNIIIIQHKKKNYIPKTKEVDGHSYNLKKKLVDSYLLDIHLYNDCNYERKFYLVNNM